MANDEGLLYGSQAVPLCLPTNIGFDPSPNGDASMFESGHRQFDSAGILPTLPVDFNLDMLCKNGLAAGDVSAFAASIDESDTAVIAADVYPSDVPLLTQKSFAEDVQTREASYAHNHVDCHSFPTSGFLSQVSTVSIRNRYPTTEDWEFCRPIFTRLYRDENRTLKEVKSIMKATYDFHATDKMYKTRIRDWQLFKNQKAAEKEQIVHHLEAQRKLGIDLGQPLVRGQEVKEHKIARHLRDKRKAACLTSEPNPRDEHNRDMQSSAASTRVGHVRSGKRAKIRRKTFSPAISFSRIDDPIEYRNTENLLLHIDHYFSSKLENNPRLAWDLWVKSSSPPRGGMRIHYTYQGRAYTCTSIGIGDVYSRFVSAKLCFKVGRTGSGWKLIYESTEMIRPCLSREDPYFFTDLLEFLGVGKPDDLAEIVKLLLDLIAGMASVVYGERHPISQICHALRALWTRDEAVPLAQRRLLDTWNRLLGNDHDDSLSIQSVLFRTLAAKKSHDEAKRPCREFIAHCELIRGPSALITRLRLYGLAQLCYEAGGISEATNVISELAERGKDYGATDQINIGTHALLGFILAIQGDYDAAEDYLWMAVSSSLTADGPQHTQAIQIHYYYKWVLDKQQASQETFRGRTQSPKVSCDTLKKPFRYFPQRRAKSLGSKSRLDP